MNRSAFINKIAILFGIATTPPLLLEACDREVETEEPLSEAEILYNQLKEQTAESGFFLDAKLLYIDITHENYASLLDVGSFVNDLNNYVLLLRKTEEQFLAFNNCCPHLGTTNRWSYTDGKFKCANHGNSYGTGIGSVVNCNSNRSSGNLKSYHTEINQDILMVDFNS